MNIALTPEQQEIVKRCVDSGRSQSEREAVDQALRLLDRFDRLDSELLIDRDVVRTEIRKGIDQLDRGEGARLSGRNGLHAFFEEIKAEGREGLAEQQPPTRT